MNLSPRGFCEEQERVHLYYVCPAEETQSSMTVEKLDNLEILMQNAFKNIITSNISCKRKKRKHSSEGKLITRTSKILEENRSKSLNYLSQDHSSYNKYVESTTDAKNLKILWKFLPQYISYDDLVSYIAIGRVKFGPEVLVRLGVQINLEYPPHKGEDLNFVKSLDRYGNNSCYATFYYPDGTNTTYYFSTHNYCKLWYEMKDIMKFII